MSRLVVKNLPSSATEDVLRNLFSTVGTITDIQLKVTSKGKSRNFAFIGYHNENEATEAIRAYNNSYMGTSKLAVEHCRTNKLQEKNSETRDNIKSSDIVEKSITEVDLLEKYKDDPMFEEFLQVHAPQETSKLQNLRTNQSKQNESEKDILEDVEPLEHQVKQEEKDKKHKTKEKKNITLYTVKMCNLPWQCKKGDIKTFFKPLHCFTIRLAPKKLRIAYVGFKADRFRQKALLKDKSFLNGSRIKVKQYDSNPETNAINSKESMQNTNWKKQEEALKNEESIAESGSIFLRNLSYTTTEDDIEKLFSKYGLISEVNLPVDPNTRQMKGFGTITFVMPEHAAKAYSELDGSILHGRMLHLLPAKSKDKPQDDESTNYKKKKEQKQKEQAGKSFNWNALFVDPNAVAEVVAERYGTSKEAILGPESKGSAPVKLALAETQIVTETKQYLERMGVKLDVFAGKSQKRSKTIILVKNLPHGTNIKELREIFQKYGQLGRIILPQSGLSAIIEFLEPSEARKAFTNLAYSKFKSGPLYLEWAPEGSLEAKNAEGATLNNDLDKTESKIEEETLPPAVEEKKESKQKEKIESNTILFIRNLALITSDENLKKHFEACGPVVYATVRIKNIFQRNKEPIKTVTGFVRYVQKASAEKALIELQNSTLDGNVITLMKSDRTEKDDLNNETNELADDDESNKRMTVLIKNIPFEATSKEVEQIFSTFGGIKSVRLPMKWGGSTHRGFGFVEFTNEKDAKIAFEALCQSTHLLGRRLILEWAKKDDSVEETRKRTADHFGAPKKKKSKKAVFNIE